MFARGWGGWIDPTFWALRGTCRQKKRLGCSFRPRVESLEARAMPTVLTLAPSADNTLYDDPAGLLSNGAGQHFYVGDTKQASNEIRRGAIKFDLSAVPVGSQILSATLSLHMSMTISGPQTIGLHRALLNWGEGTSNAGLSGRGEGAGAPATTNDVTWIYTFFNTQRWNTPGGDFVATPSASTTVADVGSYTWTGPGMIADVQQWVNHPGTAFGWILTGNETIPATAKQFDTEANITPADRPVLTVVYTLPVPDLTMAMSHVGIFHPGDAADTYSITVRNFGAAPTNGTPVTVTDTLPSGLTPTAADLGTVNGWSVSFKGQTVTATRSDVLLGGASYPKLIVTVSVADNIARTFTNTATVAGGGSVSDADDTARDPTASTVVAGLVVATSHTGTFHQRDVADTFVVVVRNAGAGPTVGTVAVTDVLPAGLSPTAADHGLINGWLVSFSGSTITATRSDALAAGTSYPVLTLTVSVAADAPAKVTNIVSVSGGGELGGRNNTAFDIITIFPLVDPQRRRGA